LPSLADNLSCLLSQFGAEEGRDGRRNGRCLRAWPGRPGLTNEPGELEDEADVDDEAGAVEHDDADNV